MPAGQGPNGRLPAASAAARAPRPGLRPGPRACVVRACVRAGARRPRASARACRGPGPVRVRALPLPLGRVECGAARAGRRPLFGGRGTPAGGATGARSGPDAAGRRGWGLGCPLDHAGRARSPRRGRRGGAPRDRERPSRGLVGGTNSGGRRRAGPGQSATCRLPSRPIPRPGLSPCCSGLGRARVADTRHVLKLPEAARARPRRGGTPVPPTPRSGPSGAFAGRVAGKERSRRERTGRRLGHDPGAGSGPRKIGDPVMSGTEAV